MTDSQAIASIQRIGAVPTILQAVSAITGLRLSLVARVTENTWTACAVHDAMAFGLSAGDHLEVATTLCSEVRASGVCIVIDKASEDPKFKDHPTPKMYGFESYIAVPIFRKNGEYFGNVCALDSEPRPLRDNNAASLLGLFAELVGLQLDADETADLREQFIAVIGHDLRNPLSAVLSGADLLLERPLEPLEKRVVNRIRSSGHRMSRLLDNIVDFARGRLGGGIGVGMTEVTDLDVVLKQVVDELATAHPTRTIRFSADGIGTVRCDRERIAQLLSNLVANALTHGDPDRPVEVAVKGGPDDVTLSVKNWGEPIPEDTLARMFQPYFRRSPTKRDGGLGLGLYIVSEIAKSHAAAIETSSTAADGTTFRCRFPRR